MLGVGRSHDRELFDHDDFWLLDMRSAEFLVGSNDSGWPLHQHEPVISLVIVDEHYHECDNAHIATASHMEASNFYTGQNWSHPYISHRKHVRPLSFLCSCPCWSIGMP